MARPKEPAVSLAFQEKCETERDKLQQRLAKQLRKDMKRLLDEGSHSDVMLLMHGDSLKLHSPLLKLRAPGFYQQYIKDNLEGVVTIEEREIERVKRFISAVYSEDALPDSTWVTNDMNGNGNPIKSSSCASSQTNGTHSANRNSEDDKENTSASTNGRPLGPERQAGCCDLGTDLLNLYHTEINTDVIIEAKGKYFKAHRFILCTRSSYFAAMLGGSWKESTAQEIKLEGISAGVMEQALLYIYGGVAELSAVCDVGELVMLADMYGIVGIKEIATFVIKRDYCHFFHKPCSGCLSGISESLPLTITFGLNDIQERCLRWSNKNFVRLWPTKPFALLPREILDKCCNHLISDIGSVSVLDIILDIDKLRGVMPQVRWADPIVEITTKVMDACITYLSSHLVQTVRREQFMALGTTMAFVLELLEGVFMQAINSMPVESACKNFLECKRLKERTEGEDCDWTEDFKSLLQMMYKACAHYMNQQVHLLVATPDWNLLSEQLQNDIKEGGWYVPTNDGNGAKPGSKSGSGGAVRPNRLPMRKRPGSRPGSSSTTPTLCTPSTAGSSLSSGSRTPQTPSARKSFGTSSPGQDGGRDSKINKKTPTSAKSPLNKALKSPATSSDKSPSGVSSKSAPSVSKLPRANVPKGSAAAKAAPEKRTKGKSSPSSGIHSSQPPKLRGPLKPDLNLNDGQSKLLTDESKIGPFLTGQACAGATSGDPPPSKSDATINCVTKDVTSDEICAVSTSIPHSNPKTTIVRKPTQTDAQLSKKLEKSGKHLPPSERTASAKGKAVAGSNVKSRLDIVTPSAGTRSRPTVHNNKPAKHPTSSQKPNGVTNNNEKNVLNKPTELKQQTSSGQKRQTRLKSSTESGIMKSPSPSSPRSLVSTRSQGSNSPRSRTSSLSSPVSSPRSSVSGSRLPVTERPATKRPRPESRAQSQITRNNDAVFAKCTSMRIAAMKKGKRVDPDIDLETESVVSVMSHIAVQGSRTPSVVDFDLWSEEPTINDVVDGTLIVRPMYKEVNFAPPKIFTYVIMPKLQPSFGYPRTDSPKVR